MIYDISYKTLIGSKALRIIFHKIDGFISTYDGTLFGSEKYDAIYDRIRDLISLESDITYISPYYFAKVKVFFFYSLPIEKNIDFT